MKKRVSKKGQVEMPSGGRAFMFSWSIGVISLIGFILAFVLSNSLVWFVLSVACVLLSLLFSLFALKSGEMEGKKIMVLFLVILLMIIQIIVGFLLATGRLVAQ